MSFWTAICQYKSDDHTEKESNNQIADATLWEWEMSGTLEQLSAERQQLGGTVPLSVSLRLASARKVLYY